MSNQQRREPKHRQFFRAADNLVQTEQSLQSLLSDDPSTTSKHDSQQESRKKRNVAVKIPEPPPTRHVAAPHTSAEQGLSQTRTELTEGQSVASSPTTVTEASTSATSGSHATSAVTNTPGASRDSEYQQTHKADVDAETKRQLRLRREKKHKGWGQFKWRSKKAVSAKTKQPQKQLESFDQMWLSEIQDTIVEIATHTREFNQSSIIPNRHYFPDLVDGDILEIRTLQANESRDYSGKNTYTNFVGQVSSGTPSLSGKVGLSVLDRAAAAHGLKNGMKVKVQLADLKNSMLEFVQLSFEDQYAGRNGLWRVQAALAGTVVYVGQRIHCNGLTLRVTECYRDSKSVCSGVIHARTKLAFRSRSAHVMLLIQLSREMWEVDNDGISYMEHTLTGFLADLFQKWNSQNMCHSVTVVLFSRTWFDYDPALVSTLSQEYVQTSTTSSTPYGIVPDHHPEHTITSKDIKNVVEECDATEDSLESLRRLVDFDGTGVPSCLDLYSDILDGARSVVIDEKGKVYEDCYMVVCEHVTPASMQSSLAAFREGLATTIEAADTLTGPGNSRSDILERLSSSQSSEWSQLLEKLRLAVQQFPLVAKWGVPGRWKEMQRKLKDRLYLIISGLQNCGEQIPASVLNSFSEVMDEGHGERVSALPTLGSYVLPKYLRDRLLDEAGCLLRSLRYSGQGVPSLASSGNFLEALNMCSDQFENHNTDRRLRQMGQHIILLTAGQGVYSVDFYLSQMTKQRILDSGIGCDVVSVAEPPMHNVPLFVFRNQLPVQPRGSQLGEGEGGSTLKKCRSSNELDQEGKESTIDQLRRHQGSEPSRSNSWGNDAPRSSGDQTLPNIQQSYLSVLRTMCTDFQSYNMPYWFHLSFYRIRNKSSERAHTEKSSSPTEAVSHEGLYNAVVKWTSGSDACQALEVALSGSKNKEIRRSLYNSLKSKLVQDVIRDSFGHGMFHHSDLPGFDPCKQQILDYVARCTHNSLLLEPPVKFAEEEKTSKRGSNTNDREVQPYLVPSDRMGSLHMPRLTPSGYPLPDALFSSFLLLGIASLSTNSRFDNNFSSCLTDEPFPVFECHKEIDDGGAKKATVKRVVIGTAAAQDAAISEENRVRYNPSEESKESRERGGSAQNNKEESIPLGFGRSVLSLTSLASYSSRGSISSANEAEDFTASARPSRNETFLLDKGKSRFGLAAFCGHAFYVLEDPLPLTGFCSIPGAMSLKDLMPWHLLFHNLRSSKTAKDVFYSDRKNAMTVGSRGEISRDFSEAQQQYNAYYSHDEMVFNRCSPVDPRLMNALQAETGAARSQPSSLSQSLPLLNVKKNPDIDFLHKGETDGKNTPTSPVFAIGGLESDTDASPWLQPAVNEYGMHTGPEKSSWGHRPIATNRGTLSGRHLQDPSAQLNDKVTQRGRRGSDRSPGSPQQRRMFGGKGSSPSPSLLRRGVKYDKGNIGNFNVEELPQAAWPGQQENRNQTSERSLERTNDGVGNAPSSTFFRATRSLAKDTTRLDVVKETATETEEIHTTQEDVENSHRGHAGGTGQETASASHTQYTEVENDDIPTTRQTSSSKSTRYSLTSSPRPVEGLYTGDDAPFRRAWWSAQSFLDKASGPHNWFPPNFAATSSLPAPGSPGGSGAAASSTLSMKYGSTAASVVQSQALSRAFGKNRTARQSPLLQYLLQVAATVSEAHKTTTGSRARHVDNQLLNALRKGDSNALSAFLAKELEVSPEEVHLQLLVMMASADVNPFRQRSPDDWHINANRRRWSHIFPEMPGEIIHRKQLQTEASLSRSSSQFFNTSADIEDASMLARDAIQQFGYYSSPRKHPPSYAGRESPNAANQETSWSIMRDRRPANPLNFYQTFPPNWTSLSEPAILPTTTDYCPTYAELTESEFTHQFYTNVLDSDSNVPPPRPYSVSTLCTALKVLLGTESTESMSKRLATYVSLKALRDVSKVTHGGFSPGIELGNKNIPESHLRVLRCMIGQRLAQGFQIVVSPLSVDADLGMQAGENNISDANSSSGERYLDLLLTSLQSSNYGDNFNSSSRPTEAMAEDDRSGQLVATLSMGHTFHNLYYKDDSESIDIKLYGRNWGWASSFRSSEYATSCGWSQSGDVLHRPIVCGDLLKFRYTCRVWNILSTATTNAYREFSANGGGEVGLCFKYMQKPTTPRSSSSHYSRSRQGMHSSGDVSSTHPEAGSGTIRSYNWNKFDIIASGVEDKLSDEVHYNSVHFRIVPSYTLLRILCGITDAAQLSDQNLKRLEREELSVCSGFLQLVCFIFGNQRDKSKPSPICIQRLSEVLLQDSTSPLPEPEEYCKIFGTRRSLKKSAGTYSAKWSDSARHCVTRINIADTKEGPEWVEVLYESVFRPVHSYHIEFRWLPGITGGPAVQEWLTNTHRKAQQLNLVMTRVEGFWDKNVLNCDRTVALSSKQWRPSSEFYSSHIEHSYKERHKIPTLWIPKNPPLPFYQGVTLVKQQLCTCASLKNSDVDQCALPIHSPTNNCLMMEEMLCSKFGFVADTVGGHERNTPARGEPPFSGRTSAHVLPIANVKYSWYRQYIYAGTDKENTRSKESKRKENQSTLDPPNGTLKPAACAVRFDPFGATWLHNSHQHVSGTGLRDRIATTFQHTLMAREMVESLVTEALLQVDSEPEQ